MEEKEKNIIRLPDFKIIEVVSALSEIVDWGLLANNVPETWKITMGEGITVFVLDTAGTTRHPDLVANLAGGVNLTRSKTGDDLVSHGTHCAGTICAEKNDSGVVGVAPKAKVFLVKVLDDRGIGTESSLEQGLRFCYEKAISNDGGAKPDIISMSLGANSPIDSIYKWVQKLYDINIPIICAVGNTGREGVCYPARYPETIAIGAYSSSGEIADFSTRGDEVDFIAPGVEIYSTIPPDKYGIMSGSSMATPFVAGVVALLLSKHKKQEAAGGQNDCKTVEQIREHLKKYSIDKGQVGDDKDWGHGIIDVSNLISESSVAIDIVRKLPSPRGKTNRLKKWIRRISKML